MKKFDEVLRDIEKLDGLELQSIRKGAEITIEKLDWELERIVLRTSKGKKRTRPFEELERLWTALCKKTAIHVDSELGGSGSSRNQPETILANLAYIEWLRYLQKKHLVLKPMNSHAFGTLKKMGAIASEEIKNTLKDSDLALKKGGVAQVVVVSGDIGSHAGTMEQITGVGGQALSQGVYEYTLPACRLLLVSDNVVKGGISPGTYLVVEGAHPQQVGKSVDIAGQKYILQSGKGLSLLYLPKG